MRFPDRKTVERLRAEYPAGCRVVLDEMDDPYIRIPQGTQGTCKGVDDAGNILVSWDMGSSLSVAYGADRCHRIRTEEEAKKTLDWYGSHQPEEDARCPRCGERMPGTKARYAVSRYAAATVCDFCGNIEALEKAGIKEKLPVTEWGAVRIPQDGGGKWR